MSNKVTQQQIEALLDNATTEEHLFHGGKSLVIRKLSEPKPPK